MLLRIVFTRSVRIPVVASHFERTHLRSLFFCASLAVSVGIFAQKPLSFDYTLRDPLHQVAGDGWLQPDSIVNRRRLYTAIGAGTALYGAATIGLYQTWYADFETTGLHSFNDWPQWSQMDKAGHAFTAYIFSRYSFAGLRWAGMSRPGARYAALGISNLLQGTIEVLDGHSTEWGFSWTDIGANLTGSLTFTVQDIIWKEQRILLKVSNDLRDHPDIPITNGNGVTSNLGYITRERFGDNFFERYLKDYNAQTIWMSANAKAFFPQSKVPGWLNLALGYGAENTYGAYGNVWRVGNDRFRFPEDRYRQWFLSPDISFTRIPTKKRWVRLALGALDFIKFPAPALEYSQGSLKGHWLMW